MIRPTSPLPTITDPVSIFGTSQAGYVDHPVIELDGSLAGESTNGLFITAANTTVYGLSITRFGTGGDLLPDDPGGAGIVVFQSAGNVSFLANYVGLNPIGVAQPNRSDGIFVDRSPHTIIGSAGGFENVISGNGRNGITLSGQRDRPTRSSLPIS